MKILFNIIKHYSAFRLLIESDNILNFNAGIKYLTYIHPEA